MNTVGDPAYCTIQRTNHQILQIVGPNKDGKMDLYYWDAVIYNNTTGIYAGQVRIRRNIYLLYCYH